MKVPLYLFFAIIVTTICGCSGGVVNRPSDPSDLRHYRFVIIEPADAEQIVVPILQSAIQDKGFKIIDQTAAAELTVEGLSRLLTCRVYSASRGSADHNSVTVSLEFRDQLGRLVHEGEGTFMGNSRSDWSAAVSKSLEGFTFGKFGYVSSTDSDYLQSFSAKYEERNKHDLPLDHSDLSRDGLIGYFSDKTRILHDIEGLWSVSQTLSLPNGIQDAPVFAEVAIIRDTVSLADTYYEFVVEEQYAGRANEVSATFKKAAQDGLYICTQHGKPGHSRSWTMTLEAPGVLKGYRNEVVKGRQVQASLTYFKIFPGLSAEADTKDEAHRSVGQGSGFFISRTGMVVTNWHVVEGADTILVFLPELGTSVAARLKLKDKKNDLAILAVDDVGATGLSMDRFPYSLNPKTSAELGEEVFSIGYPLSDIMGSSPKVARGSISATLGFQDDPRLYQISNPVQPGNSGSPLITKEGEVVGVVVSTLATIYADSHDIIPQNVNYAIKTQYLIPLLEMLPDFDWAEYSLSDGSMTIEEKIDSATDYVVLIRVVR